MIRRLAEVQALMTERGLRGWLLADFRGSNPVFVGIMGGPRFSTRRAFLWVPAVGEPELLHSVIDRASFAPVAVTKREYVGWREMDALLTERVAGGTVAVEWSPEGAVPHVDYLSAGGADRLRALGATLAPSAELVLTGVAAWSDAAHASHLRALAVCEGAMDAAFDLVQGNLGRVTEHEVQALITERIEGAGLGMGHPAIVAYGTNAGDPHYAPSPERPVVIREGAGLLIDLWGRETHADGTFADITWIAACGEPSAEYRKAADTLFRARDASFALARERWTLGHEVRGWELDRAAADVIHAAGHGADIRTRTGHSLSPGEHIHGLGFHLDDLETRDERPMLPRAGFTIEPGIYREDLGARTEVDVWVHPDRGPEITGRVQRELVVLG